MGSLSYVKRWRFKGTETEGSFLTFVAPVKGLLAAGSAFSAAGGACRELVRARILVALAIPSNKTAVIYFAR